MATAAVVVERELVRASRRPQTFAQRGLFVLVLFGFVVVYWENNVARGDWDASTLARAGSNISEGWMWIQFLLLAAVAPIVVAQAIVEEKAARTLELLSVTKLSPRRILWGKILSRVLVLEGLVLVGLPILALCISLGGVEPVTVLNGVLQATAAVLALSAVAACLALYADGPIGPAVLTWMWAFGAWVVPSSLLDWGHDPWAAGVTPFLAMDDGHGLWIAGPLASHAVLAAAAVVLAGRQWAAMATSGDPDDEDLSIGVWAVEGVKRKTGLLFGLLVMAIPPLLFTGFVTMRSTLRPLYFLAVWGWWAGVLLCGTLTWLLVCRAGFRAAARRRAGERLASRRRRLREVVGNPVLWREVRTSAHGLVARWAGRAYIVLALVVVLPFLGTSPREVIWWSDELMGWSFAGFFAAAAATVFLATSSLTAEKRRRTLELLRVSAMSPRAVLAGKLLAVGALVFPLAALSGALHLPAMVELADEWRYDWYEGPVTEPTVLLVRWAADCVWGLSALAFLGATCQAIALRARTPGKAWAASLGWAAGLLLVPIVVLAVTVRRNAHIEDLIGFLNPGLRDGFFRDPTLGWSIWLSAGLWFGLALVVFLLSARRLRVRPTD